MIWSQLNSDATGDVVGPASSTNNNFVAFDGTTGKLLKDSGFTDTSFLKVANDLSDLNDAPTARTNLGLGTIATQASSSVTITGGTITGITDIVVADGGTGVSSFTAYAVICGGTTATGALQSIAGVGTSGQILTSNGAGALPTFQDATSGISSAFNAYEGTTASNVTGDGTEYYLGNTDIATTLTERFDLGGDFTPGASGGALYTAPADGKLQLNYFLLLEGLTTSHTITCNIRTSNENYTYGNYAAGYISGNFPLGFNVITDMDAADIAQFVISAGSGTKVVDIHGSGTTPRTVISGFLL